MDRGSGAGPQAHQAPGPWWGGQGPACRPDAKPRQHLLCLSEQVFHILFRWLCGAQAAQSRRTETWFLPPPGTASLWDSQVPLLSEPQFPDLL